MLTLRSAALAVALPCAFFLAACGGDVVSKSEVEKQVSTQLGKLGVGTVSEVTCPKDLDAKVGAKTTCTMADDKGVKYEVTVNVTAIKDGTASMHIEVTKQLS